MSDKKYTLPGMADWSFKVPQYSSPMLWHKGGAGLEVTTATSAQDIAEGIKAILRQTTLTPDEAVFEVVARAALNIDWQAMLRPSPVLVAPLLNAAPAQKADNTAAIAQICANLETAYYAVKKL